VSRPYRLKSHCNSVFTENTSKCISASRILTAQSCRHLRTESRCQLGD
jgi:hypothetical protein